MYIIERLQELVKTVYLKPASAMTVLTDFYEVYDDIIVNHGQSMQEYSPDLLNTLISILTNLDEADQEVMQRSQERTERLIQVFDNLSASFPDPQNGNQSFAKFLWTLHMGNELYTEQNILQNYDLYLEQIETLAWLFQLECDGTPIYPVSNLLNDRILDHFDPDSEDDLLYLITSLQLFNQLRYVPTINRRNTVLELSRQYNLKILEMLCNQGELLFGTSRKVNMEKNRIMGVRCEDTILIRTTDLSRRAPSDIEFEYEINRNNKPIAKFFTYSLEPNHELCSLDTFFRNASSSQCLEVFLNCLKNKAYNVFMEDSVVYNSDDKEFVGWCNPLVSHDPVIVSGSPSPNSSSDTGENQFFSSLDDRTNHWFKPTVLRQSGIDRLTIDYIIGFYDAVCKPLNVSARSILCDDNCVWNNEYRDKKDEFAQNLVVKSFFDHVLNGSYDIPSAIISYTKFIQKYYSSDGEISAETRLIFPYSFYIPFKKEEDLLIAMLKSKSEIVNDGRIVQLAYRRPAGWCIIDIPGNFTFLDISTLEEATPPMLGSEFIGLFDECSKKVYVLSSRNDKTALTAFKDLKRRSGEMMITQENLSKYNNFLRPKTLENLIYGIGIPNEIIKRFWPGYASAVLSRDQVSPLLLFKIIHHINFYQITEDKLNDWKKLIFDCHLVDPSNREDPMYASFRSDVCTCNKDANCLMISKRSFADKSTLGAILNTQSERFTTDSAFDSGAINQHISFNEATKRYHLSENGKLKQEIKSIVFLTDNIISGKSTYDMLSFHFSGQATPAPSSSYYVKLDPGKTILEIIKANNPRIELHTVFWFSSLHECTVLPLKGEFNPVKFPVSETENVKLYVKAAKTYSQEKYLYTKDAFELAQKIYGEHSIPAHNGDLEQRHLVFRFNNMPGFSIFPPEVRSGKNKVGLFTRRN